MEQLATGTIIVHPPKEAEDEAVAPLCSRVECGPEARPGTLAGRLSEYASRQRLAVIRSIGEIGAGLNGPRGKIMGLLADPAVKTLVVEHRDRLVRFGAEYLEAALAAGERRLVIADEIERKDDLVQDMIAVLTAFGARLYGRPAARTREAKALVAAQGETH